MRFGHPTAERVSHLSDLNAESGNATCARTTTHTGEFLDGNGHPSGHVSFAEGPAGDDLKVSGHGAADRELVDVEQGHMHNGDDGGGMRVTFKDLVYRVQNRANKKETLEILKRMSGYFNPSQMTAVMGPSGSGKSTLMDVLAGRKTQGETLGEVRYAGQHPTSTFLRRFTGYVEQVDTLLAVLTVSEMLMYTAELKRPRSEALKVKKEHVNSLIESLALQSCRNTQIGGILSRGISGGESKRTNVGIALVSSPRVLFLDEPTSGLDSYTSSEVMEVVQRLTSTGITICAVLNSPTPRTFELFDRVFILQRGRMVYFGDPGDAAYNYFTLSVPEIRERRPNEALIEFIVDVTTQADRAGKALQYAELYEASELKRENDRELEAVAHQTREQLERTTEELHVRQATVTPAWWAFWVLIKYRTSRNFRTPAYLAARLADKVLLTFILVTIWWGIGDDYSTANALNIAGIFYFCVSLPAFGAAVYIPSLVLERPVYLRETADGLFRPITYLTHKILEEISIAIFVSIAFSLIVYFCVHLQGAFLVVFFAFFITLCIGITVAYFVAAVSPNMDVANAALPSYIVTLLFFTGFLPRWDVIPVYWVWYGYINPLRYSWGALMINGFAGRNVKLSGSEILAYYDLNGIDKWAFLGYESLFFVFFFGLAWAALVFVRHEKR